MMALTGNLFKYMMFMFFAFLHEVAHILTAIRFKAKYKELKVYAAGFCATIDMYNLERRQKFFVFSAGIFTNLVFATLFLILSIALKQKSQTVNDIILMNALMFITNILPMKPLDGSQLFKLFLQRYTGYIKSEKIIVRLTVALLPVLFALCIIQLISHVLNISLLLISTYIFLSYNQPDSEVYYMIYRSYQNKMKKIESGEAYEVQEMIVNENATVFDVYKSMDKDRYHLLKVCDKQFRILRTVTEKKVIDCIINGNINERMKNVV